MTWESNPNNRNINNKITFVAKDGVSVSTGDIIHTSNESFYKIENITATRPAALSKHTHYSATTTWSSRRVF